MITKFFDAHIRPPRGGWSFPIAGSLVTEYSEGDIAERIAKWRRNNGTFESMGQVHQELWDYYCGREPERCGLSGVVSTIVQPTFTGPMVQGEKTKEVQGPPIWTFLNTLAVQWQPGMHQYFLATLDTIIVLLECPICREEWRRLLAAHPAAQLSTRLAICQWVNKVHNEVNARIGKQLYPYERMVAEYGAPIP